MTALFPPLSSCSSSSGPRREMTAREIRSVSDLDLPQELRKNAWASASMLMVREDQEEQ